MGNLTNKITVRNQTDRKLSVLVFDDQEVLYAFYRELRRVPAGLHEGISVAFSGSAVKIGVIHDRYEDYLVYDLFRVTINANFCIQAINNNGVSGWLQTRGVELLDRGRCVKLGSDYTQLAMKSEQKVAEEVRKLTESALLR